MTAKAQVCFDGIYTRLWNYSQFEQNSWREISMVAMFFYPI